MTLSHHLAGGQIAEFNLLYAFLFLTFILFWKKPLINFEGPALAAILMIFQLIGHICMQQDLSNSDSRMVTSHILSFFITYKFAKKIDELAHSLLSLLEDVLIPVSIRVISVIKQGKSIGYFCIHTFYSDFYKSNFLSRAPPFKTYA